MTVKWNVFFFETICILRNLLFVLFFVFLAGKLFGQSFEETLKKVLKSIPFEIKTPVGRLNMFFGVLLFTALILNPELFRKAIFFLNPTEHKEMMASSNQNYMFMCCFFVVSMLITSLFVLFHRRTGT